MFERILITAGRARSRCTAVHPATLFAGNRWRPAGYPSATSPRGEGYQASGRRRRIHRRKRRWPGRAPPQTPATQKAQIVEGGCQADVAKLREIATQSGPFQFFDSETAGTSVCSHFAKRSQFHLTQIAAAGADLDTKSITLIMATFFRHIVIRAYDQVVTRCVNCEASDEYPSSIEFLRR